MMVSVVGRHIFDQKCVLKVNLSSQTLDLFHNERIQKSYPVSTAKNGSGEQFGSECTPRGYHRIRVKIGAGAPTGAVFVGRRQTGEVFNSHLDQQYPGRDWILSRIMWLSGLEPGKNRFGTVDTSWRYIYIHGSPDYGVAGYPDSHGCIRMKNRDIVDLFDRVDPNTLVIIK